MAMMTCSVFSDVLRINTAFHVILPRARGEDFGGKTYPTLYLLHGLSDDHTAWLRRTASGRAPTRRPSLSMRSKNAFAASRV